MGSRDVDVRDVFWPTPPRVDLPAQFAMVDECVSFIEGDEVARLSTDELRARYQWLTSLTRASQALGARCLAEIDRRDQVKRDPDPGVRSTSRWLQETFNVSDNGADALLRTARQLDHLPDVDQAFRRGELGATLDTLRLQPGSRLAQLDWGPLVTGHTARRIAEDADVTPVLVDAKGDILHVGRRARTLTRRQRKALNLRDRRCQEPGCERPADQCGPRHVRHWADGGTSDLPNTRLLCEVHHARRHPENDRFRKAP